MRSFAVHALFFAFFAFFASLLQVHAALPGNGTYRIQNINTGSFLDLRGGFATEGTPVIGFTNAQNDTALQWECIRKGERFIIFRNVRSKTFIDTRKEQDGGPATGSRNPGIFKIYELATNSYQLTLHNDQLTLYLSGNANGAPVILKNNNSKGNQQLWRFIRP